MARKLFSIFLVPALLGLSGGSILLTWPLIKHEYAEIVSADEPWFEKECVTPTAAVANLDFTRIHMTGPASELSKVREIIKRLIGEELPPEIQRVAIFEYENDEGESFFMAFDGNDCTVLTTFIDSRIVPFVMVPLQINDYWNDLKPGA